MMIRQALPILASICLLTISCRTLQNHPYVPSNLDTVHAVKEVLNGSALRAIALLTKTSEDGLTGLLPKEILLVIASLRTMGFDEEINQLDEKTSKAARETLIESKELLKETIAELTITDAADIIRGSEDAATIIFKNAMYTAVIKKYGERLDRRLSDIDETKYWDSAVSTYNIFARNKIDGSLSGFIAKRAVDAIFMAMATEESIIRNNPEVLDEDVVTRVFNYYSNNE